MMIVTVLLAWLAIATTGGAILCWLIYRTAVPPASVACVACCRPSLIAYCGRCVGGLRQEDRLVVAELVREAGGRLRIAPRELAALVEAVAGRPAVLQEGRA